MLLSSRYSCTECKNNHESRNDTGSMKATPFRNVDDMIDLNKIADLYHWSQSRFKQNKHDVQSQRMLETPLNKMSPMKCSNLQVRNGVKSCEKVQNKIIKPNPNPVEQKLHKSNPNPSKYQNTARFKTKSVYISVDLTISRVKKLTLFYLQLYIVARKLQECSF